MRALGQAWLIIGLTLALLLFLEVIYRAQRTVRGQRPEPPVVSEALHPDHPNAHEPWWRDALAASGQMSRSRRRYDPFRGWWTRELRTPYVNVDADGHRLTVGAAPAPGVQRFVYMFGGSVMWGWVVRDSFTIPSLVAARLRELGYSDVVVVNLAQSAFDLAQNVATLQQELRLGRPPAIAVFLDGNNEMGAVFQFGEVGRVFHEDLIARRLEPRTIGSDLMAVLRHSALVERVLRREEPRSYPDRGRLCDAVAASYAQQLRAISALAREFRFDPIFLWQPMRATSKKALTRWEREIRSPEGWPDMVRRCTAAVDARVGAQRGASYYPMHALFDREAADVFIDDYGHMTERAHVVVAAYVTERIAERLGPARR